MIPNGLADLFTSICAGRPEGKMKKDWSAEKTNIPLVRILLAHVFESTPRINERLE
jgi:hypothetical protein